MLTDEYPELFSVIGDTFGTASDEYHFVLPDLRDKFIEGSIAAGTEIDAGLPNIKGDITNIIRNSYGDGTSGVTGAFKAQRTQSGIFNKSSSGETGTIFFDASQYTSIYSDNIDTVQPPAVTMIYIIKAINTIEIFENIQDENYIIIYPNNGTEENPANVTINSDYVIDNPFPGYAVQCQAEVYYNDQWGIAHYEAFYEDVPYGTGIFAYQHNNSNIIMKTGSYSIIGNVSGDPNSVNPNTWSTTINTVQTTLPCRIKVWKVNAINNTPVVKKTEVNVNRVDYAEGQSWCYIYPNNGTKESPANVTVSTTYIDENPFPGYLVDIQPQVLVNGEWTAIGYSTYWNSSNRYLSEGIHSFQHNEDKIVTRTANEYVFIGTSDYLYSIDVSSIPQAASSSYTTIPCRLRVNKIGKLSE